MTDQICGIVRIINGIEWICIAEPHDVGYQRKSTDIKHQGVAYGTGSRPDSGLPPASERHYMVKRYPLRPRPEESDHE